MKIKIDSASLFCTAILAYLIHISDVILWLTFESYKLIALILGVTSFVIIIVTHYCLWQIVRDSNWLVNHEVTSIERCKRRLILNGSYRTKWLRCYKLTDTCTCADFTKCVIWVQPANISYISLVEEDKGNDLCEPVPYK